MYIFLSVILAFPLFFIAHSYGKDYGSYITYFECFAKTYCDMDWEVEPLTLVLAKGFGSLLPPEFIIYFYMAIGLATKFHAASRMRSTFLPLLAYSVTFIPLLELNQIRAAASIGFLILAIQSYLEYNRKKFIFFSVLAIAFHFSALIGIAIIIRRYVIIILCLITLFLFSFWSIDQLFIVYDLFPDLAKILRLQSFASYLVERPTPTIINLKTLLLFLLSVPVFLKWSEPQFRWLLANNLLLLWISFMGIFFIPQLFSRVFDLFLVIGLIFTLGYCNLKSWYKLLLIAFIFLQGIFTVDFIFG